MKYSTGPTRPKGVSQHWPLWALPVSFSCFIYKVTLWKCGMRMTSEMVTKESSFCHGELSTCRVCERPSRAITPQSPCRRVLGAWDASVAYTACPARTVMLLSKVLIDRLLLWTPSCLLESSTASGVGNMVYFWPHSRVEIKCLLLISDMVTFLFELPCFMQCTEYT